MGLCGQRRAKTKVYSIRKCKTIERTRRSTKEWIKKKTETNEGPLGAGTPVVAEKGEGLTMIQLKVIKRIKRPSSGASTAGSAVLPSVCLVQSG